MDERTTYAGSTEAWVTFCMTTFKRPDFLRTQLKTLQKQTFSAWRAVVSDNDPEGSAAEIVEEIADPRISYYVNEANLGMVKSFNRSLSKADTEWVVMITDDDPVYPEMLETLYGLTQQYPGFGMYIGGCDIFCETPLVALSSRLKVGTNSCLANLPIGTIRTYTGQEFPFAYFKGDIGGHLLWSNGIVKREIALGIEGMPDFGAPYNTDFGYTALSGAYKGALLLNTSLGRQVVHGANYGFTESDFEKFYITPEKFIEWIRDHLPAGSNYEGLRPYLETFTARWTVEYAVSIKKFMREKRIRNEGFENVTDRIFRIPFLRKWKWKYRLMVHFPTLFKLLIALKTKLYNQ
jgi:glycosyltransferase involved in cell wall biosynthesis